ncbi:hypothetical protein [Novipirellula artificiosorum]|uniref:hypothetical protein n=1 Tax=Novipirellula artificiosorum TaxID=2528016 RepID=UPI0011B4654C|nr:hypothetical protein [Novipirellula artificiosorum]
MSTLVKPRRGFDWIAFDHPGCAARRHLLHCLVVVFAIIAHATQGSPSAADDTAASLGQRCHEGFHYSPTDGVLLGKSRVRHAVG